MGRIGQAVALRASAFGMPVQYHNRTRLANDKEYGAQFHESLESLLSVSDVFCVCAPSTPQLKGSINAHRLALLPHGAIVVNVARGDLIDEAALFAAVQDGCVGAVGADVYCGEPNIDARWMELPNATLLPHIGSATHEVRTAMGMLALDGIRSHFRGVPAANLLNPEVYPVAFRSAD
jgi:glyoxylate reductase